VTITNLFSLLFLAPLVFLTSPFTHILNKFGWIEGEWFRLPSPTGIFFVYLAYTVLMLALRKILALVSR
jgi:hypothetical protein